MHEASMTESIIATVTGALREKGIDLPVTTVRITIGVCEGIVPESMEFYFDLMKPGTPLESASLLIETEGMSGRCEACGFEHALDIPIMVCPECGSSMTMTRGCGITITSIEVADDEHPDE